MQVETDANCEKTVLSVDGIGAFDLVSRESMLRGLLSLSKVANPSCRLCDNSTVPHPPMCGKMMQEASMIFTKVKEANRATLLCQPCSASDSTALWWPLRGS